MTTSTADRLIENHLVPYFGSKDLRDVTREDVLGYIRHRLSKGSSVSTIQNGLTIVRRVFNLEMERPDPIVTHNPAAKIGKLLKQVSDATAEEVEEVDAWSREEVKTLLGVAREHDPRFYPALVFLFSTGCRRGECLGLKWEDVHFDEGRIKIRRALVRGAVTVPKGRKSRYVTMPPTLASLLLDLLGQRRRACLARGWAEVPEWVFCSETGGLLGGAKLRAKLGQCGTLASTPALACLFWQETGV